MCLFRFFCPFFCWVTNIFLFLFFVCVLCVALELNLWRHCAMFLTWLLLILFYIFWILFPGFLLDIQWPILRMFLLSKWMHLLPRLMQFVLMHGFKLQCNRYSLVVFVSCLRDILLYEGHGIASKIFFLIFKASSFIYMFFSSLELIWYAEESNFLFILEFSICREEIVFRIEQSDRPSSPCRLFL